MSKHKIRENKVCQNCGRFVNENFCPNCGQENTEVRHSFAYLVKHFVADLLHYDSSVWTTVKLLLFSPAVLSKEYLAGRRKKYVDPIKLYIFISFLAFFIPSILPNGSIGNIQLNNTTPKDSIDQRFDDSLTIAINKSVDDAMAKHDRKIEENQKIKSSSKDSIRYENKTYSPAQFDSLYDNNGISTSDYYALKALHKNKDIWKSEERKKKIVDFMIGNLTKVLFVYMPIFAFSLWLFNNKKRFLYFDSAIFTLHYFSFALLAITIVNTVNAVFDYFKLSEVWGILLYIALFFYSIFYFFRAHRLFFQQKRWISRLKAFLLININWLIILFILIFYIIVAVVWV